MFPQVTNSSSTRSNPSSNGVLSIEGISFQTQAGIALFSAKTSKIYVTIEINRKIQVSSLFLCYDVQCLRTAHKKPLELEGFILRHVCSADLEVPVRFGVVNELSIDIILVTSFTDHNVRGILPVSSKITLRKTRPVYMSAIRHKSEKLESLVVANDKLTVTDSPNQDYICVPRQTEILQEPESFVLVVSIAASFGIIESNLLTMGRKKGIVTTGVANIISFVRIYVLVMTFPTKPVHLAKWMVVAGVT